MLEQLKKDVYEANMLLPKYGLVTFTWGNVSGIDRESGLLVIKPSGVEYDRLKPEDMVVVDLKGNKVEGEYNPRILRPMLSCTTGFRRWGESCIPILPGRRAGRRREGGFRVTGRPMRIISMGRFPV